MPKEEDNLRAIIEKNNQKIQKLEEEISNLNYILARVPGHVYWLDKNNIYLGCNEEHAKFIGLSSSQEIIGKNNWDMPWHEQAEEINSLNNLVMETGQSQSKEESIILNNKLLTYISKKVPLKNYNNEIIGLMGISIDITDRKEMEKALQQAKIAAEAANHAKTEFLANVSHDVRTPLTGIITFSRYLEEQDKINPAERKELAGDIYQASMQLLNLLNGILEFVSADSATDHDLNLKSFNLNEMIDGLIQLETPAVKSHHLELKKSIDKNIPKFIISDKMKLHRILLNLIGNAIKFTEKGYIKLSVKLQEKDEEKATIIFSVEDTGIGIPIDAQPQIFERFYKVNSSYKGQYSGNGIGLNIVQTYLQLLGGKIGFHSVYGKGTTFSVTLTFLLGKEEIESKPNEAFTATLENIDSTIKILLVEDNASSLKSLRMLIKPYKLHVQEAQNAEDALRLLRKNEFDLIITDIGLPLMQGDELIAKIRQLENKKGRSRAKIIALTGHAVGDKLANSCLKAGADEVFQKPMQPKLLKTLLDPLNSQLTQETPALGEDLPKNEAVLFEVDTYPILDLKVGEAVLGSQDLAKDLLKSLNEEGIVPELEKLKKAHADSDWDSIRATAHKIKGGAAFGTVRLYYALLYMERYIKAEHRNCAEALYAQMFRVIDETVDYLDKNL